MTGQIVLSGVNGGEFGNTLRRLLSRTRPGAVGVVVAFASIGGVQRLQGILRRCGEPECRLVAGIDREITHPEALYAARGYNWGVRIGCADRGIFHPKLVVAGRSFARDGSVRGLCNVYVGSSNLTMGGLKSNVECGFAAEIDGGMPSAAEAFRTLWSGSRPATKDALRRYAKRFAERARRRRASELVDLEVGDIAPDLPKTKDLPSRRRFPPPAYPADLAVAAWAGLQSSTGDYRFQVEFPKIAGQVVNRIVRSSIQADGRLDVYCPDDSTTRPMQYKFYENNGMFRLNIPNEVPGVSRARRKKDGIAIVERGRSGRAPPRLRILKPGPEESEVVGRSVALGTWDRTRTRAYGWY